MDPCIERNALSITNVSGGDLVLLCIPKSINSVTITIRSKKYWIIQRRDRLLNLDYKKHYTAPFWEYKLQLTSADNKFIRLTVLGGKHIDIIASKNITFAKTNIWSRTEDKITRKKTWQELKDEVLHIKKVGKTKR
jgi:hypothetical protein